MLIAYKGFNPDLTCKGYKFKLDEWNTEEEANCFKNGLHCAENPLDCLSYYRWDKAVFYQVIADGDINESGEATASEFMGTGAGTVNTAAGMTADEDEDAGNGAVADITANTGGISP